MAYSVFQLKILMMGQISQGRQPILSYFAEVGLLRFNLNLNPDNSDNSKRRVCIEAIVQLYKLKPKTKC